MKLRLHFIWPLLLASAARSFAAGPQYSITALPSPPGGTANTALSISPGGIAGGSFTGDYNQASGVWQPALWQGSQAVLLPAPAGDGGRANAINAAGTAAGFVTDGSNAVPAAWVGRQLQLLDTMGLSGGYATSINSQGVIAGELDGPAGAAPFIWNDGIGTNLATPQGATGAWATAINDSGQVLVVGSTAGGNSSWIWSDGTYSQIPAVGIIATAGNAMNNLGQVVGSTYFSADGDPFGFLYSGGITSPLAVPADYVYTLPNAINDAGEIVGAGSDGANGGHALLWEDGQVYDLNTLIPADSGWTLAAAYSIDAGGDIVGTGEFDGELQAFELTPDASPSEVPEPASLGVLALGAFALLRRRRRAAPA